MEGNKFGMVYVATVGRAGAVFGLKASKMHN